MADVANRTTPLRGVHGGSASVRLTPAAPAERISLRAATDEVQALSRALGLELPERPKTSASAGGRTALWLG
ncbi:MAG: sarcosine oxidase subunit gamma, partial [Rhizobiales bacterium]|nr:sarcosine oxidase subunit gamma [Hyphomicrobiales bacterium]